MPRESMEVAVVIVGAVPIVVPRSPFYEREIDIRLSRSYGPGRYDAGYEEQGIDYPQAYVRWTENRNMQAFVELLLNGKVKLDRLVTHVFDFKEARNAYDLILSKSEHYAGILLKYDTGKELKKTAVFFAFKIIDLVALGL